MEVYKCYRVNEPVPRRIQFPKPKKVKVVRAVRVIDFDDCDDIIFVEC